MKRSSFPTYFDVGLSDFCIEFLLPLTQLEATTSSTVVRWRFLALCHCHLFTLYKPSFTSWERSSMLGGYRWSTRRSCIKMLNCDFERIPECLGAALRRLPRSQFKSFIHDLKTISTSFSSLLIHSFDYFFTIILSFPSLGSHCIYS